ncbi:MAG: transporter substrate-binding domain-containing protein [Synechococcaceae cyanobacterium]|nr:transporter substrate-binding domain-containing protein [Synechococcaceae cyanobacterium]
MGRLLLQALACGTLLAPAALAAPPPLRVGVLDGSPPCSFQQPEGHWQGKAVRLWQLVASRERLPDVLQGYPTARALLEASRAGAVDVGVGCLTVSPERLGRYRFSLPFQEAGLAVMVRSDPLGPGRAMLHALGNPQLLRVLAGYLLAIAVISLMVWAYEHRGRPGDSRRDQLRRYALVFQVLASGPGTNVIVTRIGGHGLVLLSWLVRIIGASLIVSTITLDVLRQPRRTAFEPASLADLAGRRVVVRQGSVSEQVLAEPPLSGRARRLPVRDLEQAPDLLLAGRADAVLADEQQLIHLRDTAPPAQQRRLRVTLGGQLMQSQALVFSPRLDPALEARINRAISQAKRDGLVR